MGNFPNWLTEQIVRGIRGFNLDAYLVALEGWRRGLTLKWYHDAADVTNMKIIGFNPLGKTFSLTSNDKIHFFYRSRGDKIANEAVEIGANKQRTKELLIKAGISVPKGERFDEHTSVEEICERALELGFPLVVKPTFGSLGKGVTTNINTETELRESIKHVRDLGYGDLIVERHVSGEDLRIYVVGDQAIGVTKRMPANIVGDGNSAISKLIESKNITREANPYLATRPIKIDDGLIGFLQQHNYSLESVPEKGQRVYLRGAANISAGGDPIDVTDGISSEIKDLAIKAIKAIPGLYHAGVDVIINETHAGVIEINPTADISMHVFPLEGTPRNIPEAIIDHYFPETEGMAADRTRVYFDYRKIRNLLERGLTKEIELTDAPSGKLYAKRYVISGKVQKVGYRKWIRRQALKHHLHGYTRNLKNGKVVVVVGSEDQEAVNNFKKICYQGPRRAKVEDVKEYLWETQIKAGFEIRKTK